MTSLHPSSLWQQPQALSQAILPPAHRDWLLDPGSLTARLRHLTGNSMTFIVRRNGWGRAMDEERDVLEMPSQQRAWLREIDWVHSGALWVKGRVVIPEYSFVDEGRQLKAVGDRPIGEILFSDPTLKRSVFDVAVLPKDHFYHGLTCERLAHSPAQLWARRSVFYFYGKPLLVSEMFLPAIFEQQTAV